MAENFPPGTRIKLSGPIYRDEEGIVIDIDNPPCLPKQPFIKQGYTYVLLDNWTTISRKKAWRFSPFLSIPEDYKHIKKMNTTFINNFPKFEEEKEDFLSAEKNHTSNNCPECNIPGEYVNGACKCPNC